MSLARLAFLYSAAADMKQAAFQDGSARLLARFLAKLPFKHEGMFN